MGWGVISGEERMLPTGGSNEIEFESGKVKRVRLLLAPGQEPYSFFQHTLEVEKFENGQTTRVFRTVNCPKTKANPYAPCKLCDGQQAKRRVRHVAPAFDHELQTARFLSGGDQIWTPIATLHKMGIDPTGVDFGVLKSGKDRNDTSYSVQNLGPSAFVPPANMTPLQPVDVEYRPHTEDEMKSVVEGMGLDWYKLTVPPDLVYPATLQEALDHVVPNTKYKGQTMKQIFETNKGMIEFFSNSNRQSPEKAYAQVILVALAGANIPGVPNLVNGVGAQQVAPAQQQPVAQVNQQPVASVNSGTVSPDRQGKINQINQMLQSNPKFVQGGYEAIVNAMKTAGNGKSAIAEFTDGELDAMLTLCQQQ